MTVLSHLAHSGANIRNEKNHLSVIDLVLPIQANAPRILQVDLLPTSAL